MPSTSKAQQTLMAKAYERKKAGHPRAGDPKMPLSSLRDFASTPRSGLPARASDGQHQRGYPHRAKPARGYGRGPVG